MSNALSSFGTLLKVGDGAGTEVFTTIAEVRDINGPTTTLDTEEVTSQTSANGYDEHIGTILRGGDVSFDINYIPTDGTHDESTGLISIMNGKALNNFQIVMTDSGTTTWSFAALVTAVGPTMPVAGALRASITLKISGKPTLA